MHEPLTVACVQAEPACSTGATLDRLAERTAEAAAQGAGLVVFPETFIPAYPSSVVGEGARRLGGSAREGGVRAARTESRSRCLVPTPTGSARSPASTASGSSPGSTRAIPPGRARSTTRCSTTRLHGELALHHSKLVPTNHERLIWGQGDGARPARARDADRADRRPDLLGELHAARALLALRVGRRDLHRLDGRRRRRVAGDARPHRPRVEGVRGRAVPLPARGRVSGRLPASRPARRARGHRPGRQRDPRRRTARISPGRSTTRRGSSTPSSIRRASPRSGSASTPPATTTGRTCCA